MVQASLAKRIVEVRLVADWHSASSPAARNELIEATDLVTERAEVKHTNQGRPPC
jgi:ATP:corrinoid adenosyltransferase